MAYLLHPTAFNISLAFPFSMEKEAALKMNNGDNIPRDEESFRNFELTLVSPIIQIGLPDQAIAMRGRRRLKEKDRVSVEKKKSGWP
ncbi:hypothetical protein V1477_020747 [Vespula maculifrons]|uniref:Uncharacterized protein n=1 Tax=Vespula maculifrons TaxID=7453 RepID=A0ABD2ANN6_VESMC